MSLTKLQREFIIVFVSDGEYDLMSSCNAIGVRPSEALAWFRDDKFQKTIRTYEHAQLSAMGFGPLRVVRDTLAIAHSDIGQVQAIDGDLSSLPRHVRIAIKKVEFKTADDGKGNIFTYPSRVEMHDKLGALKMAAEWFDVGEAPEVKATTATDSDDGVKRITGLIVRPPLTKEEREAEDLLK